MKLLYEETCMIVRLFNIRTVSDTSTTFVSEKLKYRETEMKVFDKTKRITVINLRNF